ncbi:PAP2/haloperoxidase-like protein [Gracilaria domingensis]|nr:PAP2/haloperoxidase-like protein [Gracilaria domingensis]
MVLAVAQQSESTIEREASAAGIVFARIFDNITIDGLETPVQFRATTYYNFAAWNAWSSYHPTAADIFGRTRFKRPPCEHTFENKNTAVLYSIWRAYEASPQSFGGDSNIPIFRQLMTEMGLDPDNNSTDLTTPIGIGNRAGYDTARMMKIDGWNSDGDLTSTQSNYAQPFLDYTGYAPKNSPWKIRFPFKWQPLLEDNGRGFFFRQENVVPYAGQAIAFGFTREEMNDRKIDSPYVRPDAHAKLATKQDIRKLKSLAKEVLDTSATLTDEQRLLAEFFDNKAKAFRTEENPAGVPSIATALRFLILGPALDLSFDEDIMYGMGAAVATFDSMVAAWKEKRRHDLVRPTGQTMEFLFGNRKVNVWGGPGKGAVQIKAGEWQPLIRTMPHAEFPSGSACTCSTLVEHALANTNQTDEYPFEVTVPKGST